MDCVDVLCDQVGVWLFVDVYGDVDVLFDEVDEVIVQLQVYFYVGVGGLEVVYQWYQFYVFEGV